MRDDMVTPSSLPRNTSEESVKDGMNNSAINIISLILMLTLEMARITSAIAKTVPMLKNMAIESARKYATGAAVFLSSFEH